MATVTTLHMKLGATKSLVHIGHFGSIIKVSISGVVASFTSDRYVYFNTAPPRMLCTSIHFYSAGLGLVCSHCHCQLFHHIFAYKRAKKIPPM